MTASALRAAGLAAAVLLIHFTLILPNNPGALDWSALRRMPLELPLILAALVLAGPRLARPLRLAVTGFLSLMVVIRLADLAAFSAYLRPFNAVLDLHLLPASWRLASGAIGTGPALAAAAAILGALAMLGVALWWATGRIAALALPPGLSRAGAFAIVPLAGLVAVDAAREIRPFNPPGTAFTARLAWEHARDMARARADLADFRRVATEDPAAGMPPDSVLRGLEGRDVLLVFVESYGRSTLENPLYAPTIRATLAAIETELAPAGLAARSGYLTAPMVGGQSWLAHASVLSGLWIDTQGRYRALLASPRRTLLHLARSGGWRTVGVMPAITLPWPEAGYFGYDRTLAAADLGYAGAPFNWVTMPDQFTLRAFERAELEPEDRAPVFAEIAMISSHAPWTPVAPILDWDTLGDGRVFDPHATAGDPPEVVWRDRDRIRDQFRLSIEYTLRVVGGFAVRRAEQATPAPLIVVLGDHQPAALVSQDHGGFDVPIHVIGPPDLLASIDGWGWTPGMIPAADAPAWRMDAFRDRFLAAFSERVEASTLAGGDLYPRQ
jgi:hypothetical protein